MPKILIVDDKASMRKMLADALQSQGHSARAVGSGSEALLLMKKESFDLVLTDMRMPDVDGLELTREIRSRAPETAVLVMTAYGSVDTAVEAMRLGASHFLTKPFSLDQLKVILDKTLAVSALQSENRGLRAQLDDSYRFEGVLGTGKAMRKVHQLIKRVAPTESVVLIQGESGTGKELVARAIHANSARAAKPFLKVNCAALAQGVIESELFGHERGSFTGAHQKHLGRFELAAGGSLFLDEIGDLSLESQAKLLRALQEKEIERVGGSTVVKVDVRVIAASNRDLGVMVARREFREDLYFRLNVVPVQLPALRERPEDIEALVEHALRRLAPASRGTAIRVAPDALRLLKGYRWPGNVRELENVLQRALVLCEDGLIRQEQLPRELATSAPQPGTRKTRAGLGAQVDALERRLLSDALKDASGSQSGAARGLGISRTLLIYKMKKFGLDSADFKGKPKPRSVAKKKKRAKSR